MRLLWISSPKKTNPVSDILIYNIFAVRSLYLKIEPGKWRSYFPRLIPLRGKDVSFSGNRKNSVFRFLPVRFLFNNFCTRLYCCTVTIGSCFPEKITPLYKSDVMEGVWTKDYAVKHCWDFFDLMLIFLFRLIWIWGVTYRGREQIFCRICFLIILHIEDDYEKRRISNE